MSVHDTWLATTKRGAVEGRAAARRDFYADDGADHKAEARLERVLNRPAAPARQRLERNKENESARQREDEGERAQIGHGAQMQRL